MRSTEVQHPARKEGVKYTLGLSLAALGIVYGDIGTSPLYAIKECFKGEHGVAVTPENVLGVLSMIFWALTIVISIKYLIYILAADNEGEGGILALSALADSAPGVAKRARFVMLLMGLFGAALLYGDGMITPAISVLSAVEGLSVAAPHLEHLTVPITIVILIALFFFQRRGTAGVGAVFGPITLVWFLVLAVLGVSQIVHHPQALLAINPYYAVEFMIRNGGHGFLVLGAVFLVVTGGEALYADMGHFGPLPIRLTWFAAVLPALLLNYFGQGALLLANPAAISNPFYRMAPTWALYGMIVMATFATIIASQAIISGAFSLTRQATMLGFWPRTEIRHTSSHEIGQIYVPSINWMLMVATIVLVLAFESSTNLAAAYGVAVTTTMVITTILAFIVARHRWNWSLWSAGALTIAFLVFDLAFFGANMIKVAQGGWVPLMVAAAVFVVMITWRRGRQLLGQRIRAQLVPLDTFLARMRAEEAVRVPGTAVFMTSNPQGTPPALIYNYTHNHVVHEQVILLTVATEEVARVPSHRRVEVQELPEGFVRIIAHYGFMEDPDIPDLLAREDTPSPPIEQATFFLGRETVLPSGKHGMSAWRQRVFAFLSRNSLGATAFFNVPPRRVMEVGAQVEL